MASSLKDFLPPVVRAGNGTADIETESEAQLAPEHKPSLISAAPQVGSGSGVLTLRPDAQGAPDFSAVIKQGDNASRIMHTTHNALAEKPRSALSLSLPSARSTADTTERTRAALSAKLAGNRPEPPPPPGSAQYLRYTPANAGSTSRVVKLVTAQVDPMEPPRFAARKAAPRPPSPPAPVLHSPDRKATREEAAQWKIPPVVSNWKNSRGYVIPLDKRLAADGRSGEKHEINDRFAKFAEAMYNADRGARRDVEARAELQRERALRQKEVKEQELRDLAARARMERSGLPKTAIATAQREPDQPPPAMLPSSPGRPPSPVRRRRRSRFNDVASVTTSVDETQEKPEDTAAAARRDEIRRERRELRDRELRARDARGEDAHGRPTLKRSKLSRDRDRDISERVALGQSVSNAASGAGELAYDERLFNEGERLAGGLAGGFGADDDYNIYEGGLFPEKGSHTSFQYRPKDGTLGNGGPRQRALGKFKGAGEAADRDRPVEFERDDDIAPAASDGDPYGLDKFISAAKKGR